MSKLKSVIRHEYLTIVKQPSFWIYMLAMPLVSALIIGLIVVANRSENSSIEDLAKDLQQVAVIDASNLVEPQIVEASGQELHSASDYESLRQQVEQGQRKGLIYYPADLAQTGQFNIYINGNDFIFSNSVSEMGQALLRSSLYAPLGSEQVIALAQQGADSITTTYANGSTSVGFTRFIVPGLIAALFFIIMFFSIGYILTSISDEKENRSMEMALTYLNPRTLITGKLLAIALVTLTQILFFGSIAAIGMLIAVNTNLMALPSNFDLSNLPIDSTSVLFAIGFVLSGTLLFASFMALIAAVMPAKQANNFSAFFYILPFAPFWFMMTVLTDPQNPVVRFITYFPLTAPTTNLVRNMVGNISVAEASISLIIMTLVGLTVLWLAIKVFPKGALEFENTLSLKSILSLK